MTSDRLRDKSTGYAASVIVIACLVAALYWVGYFWQYHAMLPHVGINPDNATPMRGLLHGIYALPNFFWLAMSGNEGTIFQTGGSHWYTFWYLVGVGLVIRSVPFCHATSDRMT